jgi:hypothetical protein
MSLDDWVAEEVLEALAPVVDCAYTWVSDRLAARHPNITILLFSMVEGFV